MIDNLLASDVFVNAGLYGATMVFMIIVVLIFLGVLDRMNRQWQGTVNALWKRMEGRLTIEGDRRKEAMQHGMTDVQELTKITAEHGRQIQALGAAIAAHDTQAVVRHGQLMTALGQVKAGIDASDRERMLDLVRKREDKVA